MASMHNRVNIRLARILVDHGILCREVGMDTCFAADASWSPSIQKP